MDEILPIVWFVAIAVLWTGYILLEGFDLGVGMHMLFSGRGEKERRVMLNAIGPVWDGNEVWLLTAGAGIFAAFPFWYASLFSALYLPLLLVLVGLIMRAMAIEYRGKIVSARWTKLWDWSIGLGSLVASFAIGALIGSIAIGFAGRSIRPARMMIIYACVWYVMLLAFIHVPGITGGRLTLVLAEFDARLRGRTLAAVGQRLLGGLVDRVLDDLGHRRTAENALDVRDRHLARAEALERDGLAQLVEPGGQLVAQFGRRDDDPQLPLQTFRKRLRHLHGPEPLPSRLI